MKLRLTKVDVNVAKGRNEINLNITQHLDINLIFFAPWTERTSRRCVSVVSLFYGLSLGPTESICTFIHDPPPMDLQRQIMCYNVEYLVYELRNHHHGQVLSGQPSVAIMHLDQLLPTKKFIHFEYAPVNL